MILSIKKKILAVFSFLNSEHESSKALGNHGGLILALNFDHHFVHGFNHSPLYLGSLKSTGRSNLSTDWHG